MIRLEGICNRCGACCATADGYTCVNLERKGADTFCTVYDQRWDGMPITMVGPMGDFRRDRCAKDSDAEAHTIIARGIGRGCSLTIDPATVPAMTFIRKGA